MVINALTCSEQQFRELFCEGELVPACCETCWQQWEKRTGVADEFRTLEEALDQFDGPQFNPGCASCVAEFEEIASNLRESYEALKNLRNAFKTKPMVRKATC